MIEKIIELFGQYVQQWGYLIVFVVAFSENSLFLGAIAPGEIMALLAGYYSAMGIIDWRIALPLIVIGSVLGDNVGFFLGRKLGKKWLEKIGRWFGYREGKIEFAEGFWSEHGGRSVFFARFIAVARTFVPFLAGTSKLQYKKFLKYDTVGAIIWAAIHIALGYYFGENIRALESTIGDIGILLLVIFIIILYRYLVRKGINNVED